MQITIEDFLEKHAPLPIDAVILFLHSLADSLNLLHSQNLVWDLKDSSTLVDDGYKVSISGGIKPNPGSEKIEDGDVSDTLQYYVLPPEFLGTRKQDIRSDVFALGYLGYEAILGKPPYSGSTVIESMNLRLKGQVESPSISRQECPEKLSQIILKSLAKDPENRYQTIEGFLADLLSLST